MCIYSYTTEYLNKGEQFPSIEQDVQEAQKPGYSVWQSIYQCVPNLAFKWHNKVAANLNSIIMENKVDLTIGLLKRETITLFQVTLGEPLIKPHIISMPGRICSTKDCDLLKVIVFGGMLFNLPFKIQFNLPFSTDWSREPKNGKVWTLVSYSVCIFFFCQKSCAFNGCLQEFQ